MLTMNPDVNEDITAKLINTLQTVVFKFPEIMVNYLDTYFNIVEKSLEANVYKLNQNTYQRDKVWEFIFQIVEMVQFLIQGIYIEP